MEQMRGDYDARRIPSELRAADLKNQLRGRWEGEGRHPLGSAGGRHVDDPVVFLRGDHPGDDGTDETDD